jgi:hypothetical protein
MPDFDRYLPDLLTTNDVELRRLMFDHVPNPDPCDYTLVSPMLRLFLSQLTPPEIYYRGWLDVRANNLRPVRGRRSNFSSLCHLCSDRSFFLAVIANARWRGINVSVDCQHHLPDEKRHPLLSDAAIDDSDACLLKSWADPANRAVHLFGDRVGILSSRPGDEARALKLCETLQKLLPAFAAVVLPPGRVALINPTPLPASKLPRPRKGCPIVAESGV